MNKKDQVTKILIDMEHLIHKMIDEKKDRPFVAFDLIVMTIDTLIKEKQLNDIEDFKKAGNA